MENIDHISDAEANALLSEVYGELYGLVAEVGSRYFETTSTITATGAASYNEPTDHLYTVGLDYVSSDGQRRKLRPLDPHERHLLAGLTGDATRYEHIDDKIYLYPNPGSGSYVLRYVPQAPDLSAYADADLVDVLNVDGEAFLLWGYSVLAKSKSESDVSLALQRQEAARMRVMSWAANRELVEPRRRASDAFNDSYTGDPDWWPPP